MTPEERLQAISRQWAVRTNQGRPFFADTEDVPEMRELLDGFEHPDEVVDDE